MTCFYITLVSFEPVFYHLQRYDTVCEVQMSNCCFNSVLKQTKWRNHHYMYTLPFIILLVLNYHLKEYSGCNTT